MPDGPIVIPARSGKAAFVTKGQAIRVINTHGEQVVDTWAFSRAGLNEFMSMEHSRAGMHRLIPAIGDAMLTNHRRPILTLLEDTSGGIHDTLMAACDIFRYQGLGCTEYHDNCTNNLAQALRDIGLVSPETPSPLNLFMNIPWSAAGTLSFEPPRFHAGKLRRAAGGDGPRHRIFRLSAGHPADQRRGTAADRGAFRGRLNSGRYIGEMACPSGYPADIQHAAAPSSTMAW